MNIAFVVRSLDCGGAERQLVLLAKGLRQRGHNVSVTVFYANGYYEPALREAGVRVVTAGRRGRWDFIRPLLKVLRSLKSESAEVVHAYMNLGNIVTAIFRGYLRPAKIVWGVRNSGINARDYGWLSAVGSRLERMVARRADLIIFNSSAGLSAGLKAGFNPERLATIPNGLDASEFFIDPGARATMREKLGISDNEILIGRVGRLDPVKDYPGFIRAATLMSAKDSRLRFVCVGSGTEDYAQRLKRIGEESGLGKNLIWTGLVKEMREIYNALDILVSSSKSNEGFPNVLLEAMACGVPCVSTDVGDSREVVGSLGRIVPPLNPPALAEACLALVRERPSSAAVRASALERFDFHILVARTEALLCGTAGLDHPESAASPVSGRKVAQT